MFRKVYCTTSCGGNISSTFSSSWRENLRNSLQVHVATPGSDGKYRWPRDVINTGSGCVRAPDWGNRPYLLCGFGSVQFASWCIFFLLHSEWEEQLHFHHEARNREWTLPSTKLSDNLSDNLVEGNRAWSTVSPVPAPMYVFDLAPEALLDGLQCASWPVDGSCFISAATCLRSAFVSCLSCFGYIADSIESKPLHILGTFSACPNCESTISNAPICATGLKPILKMAAQSCKLISGSGCLPSRPSKILFACSVRQGCTFVVRKSRAKITCCKDAESCARIDLACKKRNRKRCTRFRTSRTSLKRGAQVLWE